MYVRILNMIQKKKTMYSVGLLLIALLGAVFVVTRDSKYPVFSEYMRYENAIVSFKSLEIPVYLADNPRIRTRGLSNKTYLPEKKGMLFVFEKADNYSFWMKDMNFSIDIIWINKEGEIISIEENVTPETYPTSFTPSKPALYVLEVNSGFARENGMVVGSKVEIDL